MKDEEKRNVILKFFLVIYLVIIISVLIFLKITNILQISNVLFVFFAVLFTYSLVILIVVQHRNASDVPLFNNSLAFMVIFVSGIAGQLYGQGSWNNIWTWVIVGTAAIGSVQNIIAPILQGLMKKS